MVKKERSIYEKLGIDPGKESVKKAFKDVIDNEYPYAFVNIVTDPNDSSRVVTQHLDGDGSKLVQRILHYLETGDIKVFSGMVDDALSMNTGDISASGFVFGPMLVSDFLNCGPMGAIKGKIMTSVSRRFEYLLNLYRAYGFNIKFLGGETADLPDQVKSCIFDVAVTSWADKNEVIKGEVKAGDVILGLHSDGQAVFEEEENSGLMSNGLTGARSILMHDSYNLLYPQLKREEDFYKGRFKVSSSPKIMEGMTVGQALISPTRQWAIIIRQIISDLLESDLFHLLHGITMNTGGGATKISNIGKNVIYEKSMPVPPPIFRLIQEESGETWDNMYKSYNCGIGIDIVGEDCNLFKECVKKTVKDCQIKFSQLGHVASNPNPGQDKNQVILNTPYGRFEY